ncbi:DNA polymerase B region, partial [Candidatus Haloredivivus sp. G17]
MRLQVFDVDYRTDPLRIRLFGKNSEGVFKLLDRKFRPYFYAVPEEDTGEIEKDLEEKDFTSDKREDLEIIDFEVVEVKDGLESIDVVKVYVGVPATITKLKNELWDLESVSHCREFDIPFYRRYLIDKELRPGSWVEIEGDHQESEKFVSEIEVQDIRPLESSRDLQWKSLAFDLEVIDEDIVMASFYSEKFRKVLSLKDTDLEFVEEVEDQAEMLERFIEIVEDQKADILLGYNTDEFDFDILRDKADETG